MNLEAVAIVTCAAVYVGGTAFICRGLGWTKRRGSEYDTLQALAVGNSGHQAPEPTLPPVVPGNSPGGRDRSPRPEGGAPAPPLPPGPVHIVYDARFWSCGCTVMWNGQRRPVLVERCAFHTDLHQWEEELSER